MLRFLPICLGIASADARPPAEPDSSRFGRNKYVEYRPGNLPVILVAPHGGDLAPDEIPDRPTGTFNIDIRTIELCKALDSALLRQVGRRPHLVFCHLKRTKLDANRDSGEGAQGNPHALQAWNEFHAFIDTAKRSVAAGFGAGLYVDVHAHAHALQRVELGYQLSRSELARSDVSLEPLADRSPLRTLSRASPATFAELVRGKTSFGGLMQEEGFAMVPSPAFPSPDTFPYFDGGYNTGRHGSALGGSVSAFQMETNWDGVRDNAASRKRYAEAMARSLAEYFPQHFGFKLDGPVVIAVTWDLRLDQGRPVKQAREAAFAGYNLLGVKVGSRNIRIYLPE